MKLPSKSFLKVIPKDASCYSTMHPWIAKVQGKWCFCATNGRAAVMRPVEDAQNTTLESVPDSARIAIQCEAVKDGEPVRLVAKEGGRYYVENLAGTIERRCPDITPPDLDGLMREPHVSSDRVSIMVDAKVLMDALEALLCDLKGKEWGSTKSFVKLSFARKVVEGERDQIDDGAPVLIENDMDCGRGIAKALVMPVSGEGPKPKASKSKARDAQEVRS